MQNGTCYRFISPHERRTTNKPHGVFARRSPARPNPIAFEIGKLLKVEGTTLTLRGLDVLEGTPILDIKPYSPQLDCVPEAKDTFWDKKRV